MNNTTKQKYELARKMLKGKIEIDHANLNILQQRHCLKLAEDIL